MPSSPPQPPALELPTLEIPRWLEDFWNATGSSAPLGLTTAISLALAVLAAAIAHFLTKRRENGRWAKQNTLHALQRATEAFYTARQHYEHLLRIDPWSLLIGIRDDASTRVTAPRDWHLLQESLQRVQEALIDVQLSSGRYRQRVLRLSKLAETMVEKLDETAYVSSGVNATGGQWSKSTQKSEPEYYEDAMNAITAYESAFGEFRERTTADLTAKWWTRRQHRFQRWQQQRQEARQERTDQASSETPR